MSDSKKSDDITSIEDLAEFEHSDDPTIDDQLDLSQLAPADEQDNDTEESPPEFPIETEQSFEDQSFDDQNFEQEDALEFNTGIHELPDENEVENDGESNEAELELGEGDDFDSLVGELSPDSESNEIEQEQSFNIENELSFDETQIEQDDDFQTNIADLDELENQIETISNDVEEDISFNQAPEIQTIEEDSVEQNLPVSSSQNELTAKEHLQEIKDFGENITYGTVAMGGNPPYAIMIRNIRFQEEADEIYRILQEHGIITNDNEHILKQGLETGSLLISQISEYSAIFLSHKFRRFDLDLQMGLSEEIHPSKKPDPHFKGLIRKDNLRQNKSIFHDLQKDKIEAKDMLLSTSPIIEGYTIAEYIGVISEHKVISLAQMKEYFDYHNDNLNDIDLPENIKKLEEEIGNMDGELDLSEYQYSFKDLYQDLAESMVPRALKMKANAIIGLNFQTTPLIDPSENHSIDKYQVTCTGNVVWLSKQN